MGKINKTLCALVASFTFGNSCATINPAIDSDKQGNKQSADSIQYRVSYRYEYNVSPEQAAAGMRRLALKKQPEDCWLYDYIRGVLVDIAYKNIKHNQINAHYKANIAVEYTIKYAKEHPYLKQFIFYHNHPQRGHHYEPPSLSDILLVMKFRNILGKEGIETVVSKVIESNGVWSFSLQENAYEKYVKPNKNEDEEMEFAHWQNTIMVNSNLVLYGRISLDDYLKAMRQNGIDITFEKFEDKK